jgi:hypothetical protein
MESIPLPEDDDDMQRALDSTQCDVERSFEEDARNGVFPIDDSRNSNYALPGDRGQMGIFEDYTGPDNPNAVSSDEEPDDIRNKILAAQYHEMKDEERVARGRIARVVDQIVAGNYEVVEDGEYPNETDRFVLDRDQYQELMRPHPGD